MGPSSCKRSLTYLANLMVVALALLGLSMSLQAQIQCPPRDGSGSSRDYGTACCDPMAPCPSGPFVILGGTATPFKMAGNQAPGNGSGGDYRILASTGQPYAATQLTDQQLQTLLTDGRSKLDTQLASLAQHFAGSALDYRSAASQFIGELVARTEEARDYFLTATLLIPENRCMDISGRRTCTVEGLFDAMELLAERWIVRGNEQLVGALYRTYQQVGGFDLFQVNNGLREADQSFYNAVAVYMNYFARPLPRVAPTLYDLMLQYERGRTDYTGTGFRDLRLLARAAGRKAFTRRELGQRLFALTDYGAAYDVLVNAELEILGELQIISTVYASISTPEELVAVNESLRELLAERSKITELLHYLEAGKNVLGLYPDYVEFIFDPERYDPRFNNFTHVRLWAQDKLEDAQRSYDAFFRHVREFDQNVTAYRGQVRQHLDYYSNQISALCGSPDATPDTCTGGALRDARQGVEQANLRIEAVLQDISNLQARITNMTDASDALRAIRDQIAQMEIESGNQRANLTQELSRLQAEAIARRIDVQFRRECSAPPGVLCIQFLAASGAETAAREIGRIDADLTRRTGELQAQTERQQALQRAEFVRQQDRERSIEVQRFIKDTTLEVISRRIELKIAQLALTQATATLDDRAQSLRRILAERQAWRNLDGAAEPVFRDPTLRIIRDDFLKFYMSDYEEAVRRVYLTGRALAYEINRCPGDTCPPLINNLDEVLRIVDINRLRSKLREMLDVLVDHESRYRTERQRIVIELSRLLGFRTRSIRGQRKPYKDQFKDCLRANVTRRDAQDCSSLPPECPCFEVRDPDSGTPPVFQTVVFRFPIELGQHLQQFPDPDWDPVIPPLFANVRIRSIKARIEGAPPTSGEFAGLPLSYGLTDARGNLIGTMSQRGPESDVSFTSLTGRDFIRRYNAIGAGLATLPAALGRPSFDTITASSDKFIYRTLGFSNYILILTVNPQLFPQNPGLIGPLSGVADIVFEFSCDAFTLPIRP